jgi:hypothetical protein
MANLASLDSARAIRQVVLDSFNKCREAPNEPFDESRFLAFLTVEQTFKALDKGDGHKRFYRFYHSIEDDLQIFIGHQKIRQNWDLDEFCAYLQRAVKGRKSGVRGAEYYNERMLGCAVVAAVFVIPCFLGAFVLLGMAVGGWLAAPIVTILFATAVWHYFLKDYLRYRKIIRSSKT